MDMPRYFVTPEGLAAAFKDERVLKAVTDILHGDATKSVIADYERKGLIDLDRRPPDRVDNNLLILSGALERLRTVVEHEIDQEPEPEERDLRTVPKKLYRLSSAGKKATPEQLKRLISAARHVFVALQKSEVATTKMLADATGLNRRTVANGITALRKAGFLSVFDVER